jgi:hypothetical protein
MLAGFFVALLSGHIYILIICKWSHGFGVSVPRPGIVVPGVEDKSLSSVNLEPTHLRYND